MQDSASTAMSPVSSSLLMAPWGQLAMQMGLSQWLQLTEV